MILINSLNYLCMHIKRPRLFIRKTIFLGWLNDTSDLALYSVAQEDGLHGINRYRGSRVKLIFQSSAVGNKRHRSLYSSVTRNCGEKQFRDSASICDDCELSLITLAYRNHWRRHSEIDTARKRIFLYIDRYKKFSSLIKQIHVDNIIK